MKKIEIKTWKNLESAFAGESMAYQKYIYFAKLARKNGDEEIAKLFEETAKHEVAHAQGHLRYLYPESLMTTSELLRIAAEGELYEYTEMYPSFAQAAEKDGASPDIVGIFEEGAQDCKEHAEMFAKNLEKIGKIFKGLTKVEQEHYKNYKNALDKNLKPSSTFNDSNDFIKNNPS